VASRIWPAPDYTRITLESRGTIKHSVFTLKDPERLVLDLESDELSAALADLHAKVTAGDPYIQGLRVAYNRPGVIRVVMDLKTEVAPQVFTLKPIGEYGFRLVLDLYPALAVDPLIALIEESQKKAKPGTGEVARLATIVIDPGHGGEDPGAIGRHGSREKDVTLIIARRLKAQIDAEPNMRALLTRDGDFFRRCTRASRRRAGCAPTSSSPSTPTPSCGRTRAAPRCSRFRSAARLPRRRSGWRRRRTRPTSSVASTST